jgi:hypothetical protein
MYTADSKGIVKVWISIEAGWRLLHSFSCHDVQVGFPVYLYMCVCVCVCVGIILRSVASSMFQPCAPPAHFLTNVRRAQSCRCAAIRVSVGFSSTCAIA